MPNDAERIKELEAELAYYKINGAIGLYYELNRFVNSTVTILRENTLSSLLKKPKEDDDPKKFEKIMSLMKTARDCIIDMEDIKIKLGLTGEEEKDKQKKPFIDRIADSRN